MNDAIPGNRKSPNEVDLNKAAELLKTIQDLRSAPCSPKIIQILIAPNDACWQGMLIGLGDDGVTYRAGTEIIWEPIISPLSFQENSELCQP